MKASLQHMGTAYSWEGGGSTILKRVIKGHGRADVFSCCNLAGWWEGAGVEEIIC